MKRKYKIVENFIDTNGDHRMLQEKQEYFNSKYGEENWLVCIKFKSQYIRIQQLYDKSYFKYLDDNADIVYQLENSEGVYSTEALLGKGYNIEQKTIERYMESRGLKFKGKGLIPVGFYRIGINENKEDILRKAIELGLEVVNDQIEFPKIEYSLSHHSVSCSICPRNSIGGFLQINKQRFISIKLE